MARVRNELHLQFVELKFNHYSNRILIEHCPSDLRLYFHEIGALFGNFRII